MRNRRNTNGLIGLGILVLIGGMIAMTWGNYRYASENPGGNDFLVHWVGTRSFLVDGLSPYSDTTALRIQTIAYGKAAEEGQHELRVAYPLYSIILFFPYALFGDFVFARALWMTVLELSLLLTAWITLRITDWRPRPIMLALYLLFTLFWYHALRSLINGNAVIIITLLLVGAFWAIRVGADELAGVLLAFSTIKPQVVVILIAYVIFYAVFNRRWRLVVWIIGTIAILVAAATFLIPDWLGQNLSEVLRYPGYNPPGTPGAALAVWFPYTGQGMGRGISIVVGLILLLEWFFNRSAGFKGFLWTACLTLVLSQWSGIQTDPGNFMVLFPALVLIFALAEDRWRRGGRWVTVLVLLTVWAGLWWLFISTLEIVHGQPQQSPILFFPLPLFLLVGLYWVRWWAFHPTSGWPEMPYGRETYRP